VFFGWDSLMKATASPLDFFCKGVFESNKPRFSIHRLL
jgi:hypothetical protein